MLAPPPATAQAQARAVASHLATNTSVTPTLVSKVLPKATWFEKEPVTYTLPLASTAVASATEVPAVPRVGPPPLKASCQAGGVVWACAAPGSSRASSQPANKVRKGRASTAPPPGRKKKVVMENAEPVG